MTRNNTGSKFLRYFKNPMLGLSAMTSYGIPNSLIHLPLIIMIPYIGSLICREGMKPLMVIYLIIALYVGRDLVLLAYKNIIVPAIIWILFILFIVFKAEITEFLKMQTSEISVIVTAAVSIGFLFYVVVFSRWFVK